MNIPKIEEFFQPTKHTWVVAYRHSAKYIGRVQRLLPYDPYRRDDKEVGLLEADVVRSAKHVMLSPVLQLFSPMKQIPLNKQGKPARSQSETVGMAMVPEPIVFPVDFCSLDTKMYFEGTDIQRFFSDMDTAALAIHKNFIENVLENARANESPGIELATPSDIAAVTRGR